MNIRKRKLTNIEKVGLTMSPTELQNTFLELKKVNTHFIDNYNNSTDKLNFLESNDNNIDLVSDNIATIQGIYSNLKLYIISDDLKPINQLLNLCNGCTNLINEIMAKNELAKIDYQKNCGVLYMPNNDLFNDMHLASEYSKLNKCSLLDSACALGLDNLIKDKIA